MLNEWGLEQVPASRASEETMISVFSSWLPEADSFHLSEATVPSEWRPMQEKQGFGIPAGLEDPWKQGPCLPYFLLRPVVPGP